MLNIELHRNKEYLAGTLHARDAIMHDLTKPTQTQETKAKIQYLQV